MVKFQVIYMVDPDYFMERSLSRTFRSPHTDLCEKIFFLMRMVEKGKKKFSPLTISRKSLNNTKKTLKTWNCVTILLVFTY